LGLHAAAFDEIATQVARPEPYSESDAVAPLILEAALEVHESLRRSEFDLFQARR
jgi:hypothetical protein